MKDHPILFKGDMVRAILDGRKTQTRRVIKPQPIWNDGKFRWHKSKTTFRHGPNEEWLRLALPQHCPYGVPGDLLWVKEGICGQSVSLRTTVLQLTYYKADGKKVIVRGHGDQSPVAWQYKRQSLSARFMQKRFARLWLKVKSVRVERVQEISEADAKAEGASPENAQCHNCGGAYQNGFGILWDSINKDRGFGWDVNPWVWVVEFEKQEI